MFDFLKADKKTGAKTSSDEKPAAREAHIKSVMQKTGWNRERTEEIMSCAKRAFGITYKHYDEFDLFKTPAIKLEKTYKQILATGKKEKSAKQNEREHAIVRIMEVTGWDRSHTVESIKKAHDRTGCTAKEFFIYRFYELTEAEQEEVFLIHDSVKLRKKYDDADFVSMLCNKEKTNEFFSEYLNRAWCVNTKISKEEFIKKFSDCGKVIYKPLSGNRGRGVEAFEIDASNAGEVYDKLSVLPGGVVEEYLIQHPDMSRLTPASVNTLRIVTISSKTEPVTADGKFADVAYAALRIGGGNSIVDNFHSGGMVAAVDLESGELVTDAADMEGKVYPEHPVTGTHIKGFKVPHFEKTVEMIMNACSKNNIGGYIGWDIAITEKGPALVEVNAEPGVVLLSTPYAAEHKGKKYVMEKYL